MPVELPLVFKHVTARRALEPMLRVLKLFDSALRLDVVGERVALLLGLVSFKGCLQCGNVFI